MPVVPQYPREDWMHSLGRESGSRAAFSGGGEAAGGKWDFRRKLLQDPKEREVLFRYTKAEVGGQGSQAKQAFMESVANRADAEGKTISQVIRGKEGTGSKYFPQITHSRAQSQISESEKTEYNLLGDQVMTGSNICNYCTGNASGTVGFAKGPMTAGYGGEKYGIEGWTGKWAKDKGYTGDVVMGEGSSDQEWGHRADMQGIREKQGQPDKPEMKAPDLRIEPTNISVAGVESPSFGLPGRPQLSPTSKPPEIRQHAKGSRG